MGGEVRGEGLKVPNEASGCSIRSQFDLLAGQKSRTTHF